MGTGKQYDEEFKKQAIKLAKEIGTKAAADELRIPKGTLGTWVQKARIGEIDTGAGSRTPGESLTIAQQLQAANKRIKELEKKNAAIHSTAAEQGGICGIDDGVYGHFGDIISDDL